MRPRFAANFGRTMFNFSYAMRGLARSKFRLPRHKAHKAKSVHQSGEPIAPPPTAPPGWI